MYCVPMITTWCPGAMRVKLMRNLPDTVANILLPPANSTRKRAMDSLSTTRAWCFKLSEVGMSTLLVHFLSLKSCARNERKACHPKSPPSNRHPESAHPQPRD